MRFSGKTIQTLISLAASAAERKQRKKEAEEAAVAAAAAAKAAAAAGSAAPDAASAAPSTSLYAPLPSLVVCPATLVSHWIAEAERWLPDGVLAPRVRRPCRKKRASVGMRGSPVTLLPASSALSVACRFQVAYVGSVSERAQIRASGAIATSGLVVTSYEALRGDASALALQVRWRAFCAAGVIGRPSPLGFACGLPTFLRFAYRPPVAVRLRGPG